MFETPTAPHAARLRALGLFVVRVPWRSLGTEEASSRVKAAMRRAAEARQADQRLDDRLAEVGAAFEAGAAHLADVRSASTELGRCEARRARALVAFAGSRPASSDRPDGEVGAAAAATRAARPAIMAAVSEWAVDEVAVALSITEEAAARLLADSLRLVSRLPATLAALERGEITWQHAQVLTDLVSGLSDDVRPVAERRLLERVAGKTPTQLRAAARRTVQRLDATAIARRVADAVRDRRVTVYPGEDGMAALTTVLPTPVARAVQNALQQYADAASTEGDERTQAQRMADCLVDLVLRPGEHGLAPVQAQLTVVAAIRTLLGDDEPGEVNGDLVPAAMVRELAHVLGLLPRPDASGQPQSAGPEPDPEQPQANASASQRSQGAQPDESRLPDRGATPGTSHGADDGAAPSAPDDPSAAKATAALADLLTTWNLTGTALAHRPHIALADELSGSLLALTDAAGLRSGHGLGPPPESSGYAPRTGLDRFVRLRDRRCRFPGCRARPMSCDLHHTTRWPWGATSADNLCCLCRHHHRLTHQAPGWRLRGLPDGGLEWRTPTGQVLVTYPPRVGTDDDLPGAGTTTPATERPPRAGTATPPTNRPPGATDGPAGDPPPF
jgi:hypothetical protein